MAQLLIAGTRAYWLASSWDQVFRNVMSRPAHQDILVSKTVLPDPREMGFDWSYSSYRVPLESGQSLDIKPVEGGYKVHWDYFDPGSRPIEHLRYDAPKLWIALDTIVGIAISSALAGEGKREKGALTGGLIGLGLGLLTLPNLVGSPRGASPLFSFIPLSLRRGGRG